MNNEFFNNLPFNIDDDKIIMGTYKGVEVAAPVSFWDASQELRDSIVGGCGPGGGGNFLVPNTLWFLNIKVACEIHDWCFAVWNCMDGFDLANDLFKNNMLRIINQKTKWKWLKKLREKRAIKYYKAVHYLGKLFYFDDHIK